MKARLLDFEGTKHAPRKAIPQKGVDCIQLVIQAHLAAGTFPPFSWPQYRQDIGIGAEENTLGKAMEKIFFCQRLPIAGWEPRAGDVAIFRSGKVSNHCGVFDGDRFWHVTTAAPVHHCSLACVQGKLQEVVRFTGTGIKSDPSKLKLR